MEGKTLADLRKAKGVNQKELAKLLGFSPSSIAMYETGDRTPPLNKAKKIAQFFEVPVESILFPEKLARGVQAKDEQAAVRESA